WSPHQPARPGLPWRRPPRSVSPASGRSGRWSGADPAARHLTLDLALRFHVAVDLLAELIRLGRVEVDLLLEDVREPAAGHPDVVQVLHEDQRIHGGEV